MTDRLLRVFKTVQDNYLRDPKFADAKAVDARVCWLREEAIRLAGELRTDLADPSQVYVHAEDLVIEREIVGKLLPRLVHELRNSWAYLEAEVTEPLDPAKVDSGPLSTLHWYDRAGEAHVDAPLRVGNPGDYQGTDPIEEVALAPKVVWTDAGPKMMGDSRPPG